MFDELRPHLINLAMNTYAVHLVTKMLDNGMVQLHYLTKYLGQNYWFAVFVLNFVNHKLFLYIHVFGWLICWWFLNHHINLKPLPFYLFIFSLVVASKEQLASFISSLHGHVAPLLRHTVGSLGMSKFHLNSQKKGDFFTWLVCNFHHFSVNR